MLDTLQTVLEENPEGTWEPARKTMPINDNLSAIMSAKMGTQLPPTLGYIGVGNRSSVYETIAFGNGNRPDIAENSTHIGQSGFLEPVFGTNPDTGEPELVGAKPSPHFADQLGMSDNNEFKPDYLIKKNQWQLQP